MQQRLFETAAQSGWFFREREELLRLPGFMLPRAQPKQLPLFFQESQPPQLCATADLHCQ